MWSLSIITNLLTAVNAITTLVYVCEMLSNNSSVVSMKYSPSHVRLSTSMMKPSLQLQMYEPTVLLQFWVHWWVPSEHSSTSMMNNNFQIMIPALLRNYTHAIISKTLAIGNLSMQTIYCNNTCILNCCLPLHDNPSLLSVYPPLHWQS